MIAAPHPTSNAVTEPNLVARIRVRARRTIAWLNHTWASTPSGFGVAITPHEVERILANANPGARIAFFAENAEARELAQPIRDADLRFANDPIVARVRDALDLSAFELDLLALVVATEADPWLRRAFAYIHDDASATLPSAWLAAQLFDWPAGTRVGADSNLVRWRLARPIDGWAMTSPWIVDPAIAAAMISGVGFDAGIADVVQVMPRTDYPCLYPDLLATLGELVRAFDAVRPIEILLAGSTGAGKRTLAAQVCAAIERPLIIADVAALDARGAASDVGTQVIRAAHLTGAAVYWHDPGLVGISAELPPPPLTFIGARSLLGGAERSGVVRRSVLLPSLTQLQRAALWSKLSSSEVPRPVLEWPLLPADVARAAAAAPGGPTAIVDACRSMLSSDASVLATPLPRPYRWDDLIVPSVVRRQLEELASQARFRWPVYEGWGYGKHFPMGRGIAALFAGPSGTGKTMAAQLLARELDMEIYRVDLAGIMNKYIGETEKNLRKVFDACERANVLLFFDEADALFGRRMQVKDAHDRFANVEIDYLLQRMEQFEGLAVLATNRKNEIDTAFLRRMRFIIDFLPPAVRERRELWQRALLARSPAGEELLDAIDYAVLGERLDMTGAEIKNAATSAAFLARAEGVKIAMRHVGHASRRELAKRGVVLRGDLE